MDATSLLYVSVVPHHTTGQVVALVLMAYTGHLDILESYGLLHDSAEPSRV